MAKYSISKHQSWHILVTFEIFLSSILLTERNVCWNSAKNADLSRRLLSKDLLKNDGLISGIEKNVLCPCFRVWKADENKLLNR